MSGGEGPCMVPVPVPGRPGLFTVDATWGTIAPIALPEGVRTIGELELIEHIRAGRPLYDTRSPSFYRSGTIPGAESLPHAEALARIDEFDRSRETALFCNGPQCAATPSVIQALIDAGYPPERLLYYRGGIRDWITLGFPAE